MNDEKTMSPAKELASAQRRWLLAAVAAAAGVGGAGLAWWRYSLGAVDESAVTELWQMTFQTPTDATLSMASFKGRPLLINFWATWCPPCVEELPLLDSFFNENSKNGWQVLALAVDKVGAVNEFLLRQPLSFPVAMAGANGIGLSKSLGNLSGGLPFSVLLGADGTIRQRKIGKVSPQDLALWRTPK